MPTLGNIAKHVNGVLIGDADLIINGISSLDNSGPNLITFLSDKKKIPLLEGTKASAIIIASEIKGGPKNRIEVVNPYIAFARATELFKPANLIIGIHKTAVIDPSAKIDNNVGIGPHCFIGKDTVVKSGTIIHSNVCIENNCIIGENSLIFSNVSVGYNCTIGNNAIIHSGVVIGSDGFGFAEEDGKFIKIYQLGNVVIGNNVEIGGNTCIDRAAIGSTIIKDGVKIDNLVHIAHNVEIGENSAIAGMVGIAGSSIIGKNVKMAGQVGVTGHVTIGDNVFLGAQAGVSKSIEANTMFTGTPARTLTEQKKIEASLAYLPDLVKKMRNLEKGSIKND